ncbi:MAG: AraC family transcriptional regulator [Saprospiraceae bacterium]|nr:AraC family transcriptional regulator [Saprospiraceae bacterium]MBK7809825.1 AraC family transcriptional regulator [Saprospiraceae bacterium]MBK9632064.1 AraC family transcriptional regulator [Saprospiraceae bacterium]
MWSQRCKMMLRAVLDNLGLNYTSIKLGEVEIIGKLSPERQSQLNSDLLLCGLVLLDDHKLILVEKIKILIVEMIDYFDELPILNISSYLSQELHLNYIYLSNLFSENTDMSIQQFIISYKIEKAKELLLYDEYSLKEISYRLHYSSVAHLFNQFKKVTGLSPSQFKNVKYKT